MTQQELTEDDKAVLRSWWTTPKRGCLGWAFSPQDEYRIKRAIKRANEFMGKFGKGYKPPQIDLRYYEQGLPQTDNTDKLRDNEQYGSRRKRKDTV